MTRYIGIRHRIKQTKEGVAHPTEVCISESGERRTVKLEDEQDELDFLLGRFPVKWRTVEEGEDLSGLPEHHIERDEDGKPKRVPALYEGFRHEDKVGAMLGGSGDYFIYALARRGEEVGAEVYRIAPFLLTVNNEMQSNGYDKQATAFCVFVETTLKTKESRKRTTEETD